MKAIKIKDLDFSYHDHKVLTGINLELDMGDFIAIVGANGSGKSTFIKNLLGELKPQKGTVEVLEKPIASYKSYKEIGYVPQMSVVSKVSFPITVREMVVLNLYEDFGFFKFPRKKHYKKVDEMLEYLGLIDYKNKPVNELSGGLQQRTMIARAMINNPKLLILDEPTAGVDEESRISFLKTIQTLNGDKGTSLVLVTHELDEVMAYTKLDAVYEIKDGGLEKLEIKKEAKTC